MADVYAGPEGPIGSYTDVTGVVDATAAAEIVVLVATLSSFLRGQTDTTGSSNVSSEKPDFDQIPEHTRAKLLSEVDALAAAIAAAPTV